MIEKNKMQKCYNDAIDICKKNGTTWNSNTAGILAFALYTKKKKGRSG